jgi:hypothetical protein
MSTSTPEPIVERELTAVVDAIGDVAGMAAEGALAERGLDHIAHRCRVALDADLVLIALRRDGTPQVVLDAGLALDPAEERHQVALAAASLDDPVIDRVPGLPPTSPDGAPVAAPAKVRHLRRLVTELPRVDGAHGTLTICRRAAYELDEVETAMGFAGLAGFVEAQSRRPLGAASSRGGDEIVGRLFGVGIVLHLLLRATDDPRHHHVVLDAIDQLDQAILDVRRAHL